jgi:uncharacterized protein
LIAYFDTSALLAVLLRRRDELTAPSLWIKADRIVSSRLTYAEGRAALAAVRRAGRLTSIRYAEAKSSLESQWRQIDQIEPSEALCRAAGELAERHRLRGYDAVHLASTIEVAAEDIVLATDDRALARAALAEGITTAL